VLGGGDGADGFEFRGRLEFQSEYDSGVGVGAGNRDRITDFDRSGGDSFDVTLSPRVNAFVGDGPVGKGEVGFYESSKLTIIVGNDDADPATEFEIEIVGTGLRLTAQDFAL